MPQRFNPRQMPQGANLKTTDYAPLSADITLSTPAAFQARYDTFAFPGWTVYIDGQKS
jgi:hypothetical protein